MPSWLGMGLNHPFFRHLPLNKMNRTKCEKFKLQDEKLAVLNLWWKERLLIGNADCELFVGKNQKSKQNHCIYYGRVGMCFWVCTSVAIILVLEYLLEMCYYNRKRKKEGCFPAKLNCFSCENGKAWKLKICVYAASRHLKTRFFFFFYLIKKILCLITL